MLCWAAVWTPLLEVAADGVPSAGDGVGPQQPRLSAVTEPHQPELTGAGMST